jgi:hypothetical protein
MINIKFVARKYLFYNFILQPLFQSTHHFYEKREGSGCRFGRPKNVRIRISGGFEAFNKPHMQE